MDDEQGLLRAAEKGELERVQYYLETRGTNPNAKDLYGWTPLHLASQKNHLDIAKLLLENGADLNAQGFYGWTSLHWVSDNGHDEAVALLLEHGATIDAKNYYDERTPLHLASKNGHVWVAKKLLEKGAALEATDCFGWTPLYLACRHGREGVVKVLLERGADVNVKDKKMRTPLDLAKEFRHPKVVALLQEGRANGDYGTHALASTSPFPTQQTTNEVDSNLAFHPGKAERTKMEKEKQKYYGAKKAPTLLALLPELPATTKSHFRDEIVLSQSDEGLLRAAEEGVFDRVLYYVQKGANPNAADHIGWTALHFASDKGHDAVAVYLWQQGAEVNAKDNFGWTPLHRAGRMGHDVVANLLLEKGAEVNAKSDNGETPLHLACRSLNEHKAVVKVLLEHGADYDAPNKKGVTPLHLASQKGHEAVVKLLLEEGADTHAKDNNGQTPTDFAALAGSQSCIEAMQHFIEFNLDSRAALDSEIQRLQQQLVPSSQYYLNPVAKKQLERLVPLRQYKRFSSVAEIQEQIATLEATGQAKGYQASKLEKLKQRLGKEMAASANERPADSNNYQLPVVPENAEPVPALLDDNRSLAVSTVIFSLIHTEISSLTTEADEQKMTNETVLDSHGDKGRYTGSVLRSSRLPHGRGLMKYDEGGRTFEGDWSHGRWHGYGRASFSNGDRYEGVFRFGRRHGQGIYRYSNGKEYDGNFKNDQYHGKGSISWPDGASYKGDFFDGKQEGFGHYVDSDGGQYKGSWKDGKFDGFGTFTWTDGRCYRGEWRHGMANGNGCETNPDGRVLHDGEWIDDEPIC